MYTSAQFSDTSTNNLRNYDEFGNMTFQSSNSFKLDLSVFRSGLDPNFAVLSFRHPEKSSTKLGDNTYATFIIHNYTNDIWDNDHVFLGSITQIAKTYSGESGSNYAPRIDFSTTLGTKDYQDSPVARSAFHGYAQGTQYSVCLLYTSPSPRD